MSVVSDVEQDYAQPPEEEVDEMQNVSEEDIKLPAQPTQPGEATKENSWVAVAKATCPKLGTAAVQLRFRR